ncbi:MAG: acylneuraminate cytidylyltransferase family protein [Candidatus Omnitrophota bacterium]|jgi:N-acylneuraminate cytidylyltransferase/CMP-N,N'-diacetyllegionaminic acid synthase
MYKNKKILALIPARGGSKGLPGKNIKMLSGKPLIAWSIEQALASRYIDKVVVSTELEEIASVARKYGAEVPFMRPKDLAASSAIIVDVLIHALNSLERKGRKFDFIMLLQPTSPLRNSEDIDAAIRLLFRKNAQSVVSICPTECHPYWINRMSSDGLMGNFIAKNVRNKNRQKLPVYYRVNGALYLASVVFLKKSRDVYGKPTYPYIMPLERSVDIDTPLDFELAELLMSKRKELIR